MAEHPDQSWRQMLKRRLLVVSGAFLLWSIAVEARLVYLQVLQHDELASDAESQQSDIIALPAERGDIFDRDGHPLAYNVDAWSAFANPREITDPIRTVDLLCRELEDCDGTERQRYLELLTRRDKAGNQKAFAWLSRRMVPGQSERVKALKMKGIYFRRETRRYYPYREFAAHLLGWVGDRKGGAGIEAKYDAIIGGQAGKAVIQFDRTGRTFNRLETPSTPGASVMLTVDQQIQHVAERELAEAVDWSGADGGTVIVLDVHSGEILAMANYPTFNPNNIKASKPEARKNRAVQDAYEPGSTFKIVTAGAALEEKISTPTDLINTSPGKIRFGSRVIDEAKGHNYGTLTFEDVIVKSSNVGAIKIGLKVGGDLLSHYVSLFGFGALASSEDFAGESAGVVFKASELTDSAVASVSMGYNISVTALQMAAAVSAVANGGELVEPRVVRGVIRNGIYTPEPRKVVRRVLSAGTAATLTSIMEDVVDRGTAKAAQVEGFTIAGKTGTAAKVLPGGGYSTTDYNVSFAGFVPSRNPQFTILVVIDTPRKVSPYGGTVSAPVFQKIAAAVLRYRGVLPTLNPPAPLLIARRDSRQSQPVSGPAEPPVVTVATGAADGPAVFPSLVGMSARDAVREMARLGLSLKVHGSGIVVNQRPAAGSALDLVDVATLWLERRPPADVSDDDARPADTDRIARGTP